eukprot:6210340-Pleurochrysis_carterae.AAC.5
MDERFSQYTVVLNVRNSAGQRMRSGGSSIVQQLRYQSSVAHVRGSHSHDLFPTVASLCTAQL